MKFNRRTTMKGFGGTLSLPLLESSLHADSQAAIKPPQRLLIVGNPFGAHPDHFFPKTYGKDYASPTTLRGLAWLKDRMTILSHTDHNMVSGHGREISFLSGVLPSEAEAFPEKNISLDQVCARHVGSAVRYPSVAAALGSGIRMSWTANGVERYPVTDPQQLYDQLFLNLTADQKRARTELLHKNKSILDTVQNQMKLLRQKTSVVDRQRLDQFSSSVRELETSLADRETWLQKKKPDFDISEHYSQSEVTITNKYDAIFDMIGYAFQTDLTRVATVEFPSELNYTSIDGVNRSYHGCTHNGRKEDLVSELVAIESFQIQRLSNCLKKLDSIREPNQSGSLLDHTMVLFGSGMGYGGTHSNRDLPILVAGGGFKHRGHVDTSDRSGRHMPLCNLFVTLMQRFGIERDRFNTSTGTFDLPSV